MKGCDALLCHALAHAAFHIVVDIIAQDTRLQKQFTIDVCRGTS